MTFSDKISTAICHEIPDSENPFVARKSYIHGYNISDLVKNFDFTDTFFLIFRGELPTATQKQLLNALMIGLINPGPRHPASRSAMTAAISKSAPENILPIGLLALSGEHLGASEVYRSAKFLQNSISLSPESIVSKHESDNSNDMETGGLTPGFGSRFGSLDPIANELGKHISSLKGAGRHLKWGQQLATHLQHLSHGWLFTGLAASTLLDLGFHRREMPGIFQLVSAPGVLAYGIEQSFKPPTDMPFIGDNEYEYTVKK